jgi:hypothetical protein
LVDEGCDGEQACYAANIGSVVDGCIGQYACSEVAYDNGVSVSGSVGEITRSCNGASACEYMAGGGNNDIRYGPVYPFIPGGNVTRVVDSCIGYSACER